jgi:hypothetical protein
MPDDWRSVENGLFERAVTFSQSSSVEPGDKLVLYAAGWTACFASGTALSYPYRQEGDDRRAWRVDFALDHSVPAIHNGIPLGVLNVDGRDLRVAMRRRSHIRLSEAEYVAAVRALKDRERALLAIAGPGSTSVGDPEVSDIQRQYSSLKLNRIGSEREARDRGEALIERGYRLRGEAKRFGDESASATAAEHNVRPRVEMWASESRVSDGTTLWSAGRLPTPAT